MMPHIQPAYGRRLRNIAAEYRKQGYTVTVPSRETALPSFLSDHMPDLIAEKDNDKVVVEIKRSDNLKGSNALTELAERVAAQRGWRLELVTLHADDTAFHISREWLEHLLKPHSAVSGAATKAMYTIEVMRFLLHVAAGDNNIRFRDKSDLYIARELVYRGVVDQSVLDRMETAFAWRNDWMHGRTRSLPGDDLQSEFEAVCGDLIDLIPKHDSLDS